MILSKNPTFNTGVRNVLYGLKITHLRTEIQINKKLHTFFTTGVRNALHGSEITHINLRDF